MTPPYNALRISGVLAVVFLASQVFVPASAATAYTMTLQTNSQSYSGIQPIVITGAISPAPGANTAVIIMIRNSGGSLADINNVPPQADGSFSWTSVPGANAAWTSGTFTVNATWGGGGATASQVVTFTYTPTATTTTSTTTSTVTSTSTTTTTSTTTSTSTTSTTTTTTTTSTVPEFPSAALAVVALVGVALVAVLSRRSGLRPAGRAARL